MNTTSTPPGWGKDPLSNVLQDASENAFHVFYQHRSVFSMWCRIDDLYRRALTRMSKVNPWFPSLFLPRAHSCWLAAVRLAASGQLPEAYMVLRGCLENALYAFFIHDDAELPGEIRRVEAYLRRDDGDQWKKKVKKEFRPLGMLKALGAKDAQIGKRAKQMYETAIDYGAHPNVSALLTNLTMREVDGGQQVITEYLNADPLARGFCWRYTGQVGIEVLAIFGLMWRKDFGSLGLIDELVRLRQEISENPDVWTRRSEPGPTP